MSKKLFLLGLNYYGTPYELRGCIDDVNNIEAKYRHFGFNDVTRVVENPIGKASDDIIPTVSNFIIAITKWIHSAKAGDLLAFHYSGHGTHQSDLNNDEADHEDEAICLLDGNVIDDTLYTVLVTNLPSGVKLRCLFDCCHSGTIMDLPYNYLGSVQQFTTEHFVNEQFTTEQHQSDVLMISGCRDNQTSADAWIEANKENEGAMTWSWLEAIASHGISWREVLEKMRTLLAINNYDQVPQLSLSDKTLIDKQCEFTL